MFDPTAYENMKVVVEGYLYDKDFDGEISISERNDVINIAKLSREYSISFQLKETNKEHFAIIRIKAGIENFAAELLPVQIEPNHIGSFVELEFVVHHPHKEDFYTLIQTELQHLWGEKRTIQQQVRFNPISSSESIENRIMVHFNRLVLEEQIDDLKAICDHMIETLKWLVNNVY
jgi:hypothetical protein